MVAEVAKFPSYRNDIAGSLRRMAARIERGNYGDVQFVAAVIVCSGKELACFGWGRATDLELAGAFARASVLSGCCLGDTEEICDANGEDDD